MGAQRLWLKAILAITAGFWAVDLAWLPFSNVYLDPGNISGLASTTTGLLVAGAVPLFANHRLRNDNSAMAVFTRSAADRLTLALHGAALIFPLTTGTVLFMYLASATQRPFADAALASIDARLGFDWIAFRTSIDAVPYAGRTLVFAYHALGPQAPLLFGLYVVMGRRDRLLELIALLALSAVPTALLMAAFPAAGAVIHFAASTSGNFTEQAGIWHYDQLVALRSGVPFGLVFGQTEGLVTFPSYHTALGIVLVYSVRNNPSLLWPLAIVNGLMIVATMPEGGHHLVDVIAGAGVGFVAILVSQLLRSPAMTAPRRQ